MLTLTAILTLSLIGCERTQNDVTESSVSETTNLIEEEQTVNNDDVNRVSENETTQTDGEIVAPTKEEVLAMRALVLEGMSEKEIERLTENIKIANNKMENGYLYDNLFGRLEDKNDLYWNYFDQKGEIQIGWAYDASISKKDVCKEENLTEEEFYEKYGQKVMTYNRFDANNFIELMSDMKNSVHNEKLQNDMDYIINETKLAAEMHEMEHANNIYKALHDMDYFLLRYGIEDVGKYTRDDSVVSKYYGVLSVYSN